jgi:putative spermidine/putrescine transport system permease protein
MKPAKAIPLTPGRRGLASLAGKLPLYGLALLILLPFGLLGMLSLSRGWLFPDILPEAWTLAHWADIFRAGNSLGGSFLLSLGLSLTVAALATLLGFFTSRSIAFHPQRNRLLVLAYFPFVLSPVIYAATLYFYFVKMGLAGKLLGVLVGHLLITYPYALILLVSFWSPRMQAFEALSTTLGGSPAQTFRKVLLPLAKGILLVCFFQTFLISWFEYGLTSLIGVGKVQTLTIKVYQFVQEANPFYAALASCLLVLPPLVLLWLNKRYLFRQL